MIASDRPFVLTGLGAVLRDAGFAVVGTAIGDAAAVEQTLALRPDLCLLALSAEQDAVAATEEISTRVPSAAVVLLAPEETFQEAFLPALRAGAAGFLLQDMDPQGLPSALLAVLDGQAAIPRRLVTQLLDEFRRRPKRRVPIGGNRSVDLTHREWEVLTLLREGLSTSAIGARLGVAPVTVRSHIATSVRKLRVRTRDEAVRLLYPE